MSRRVVREFTTEIPEWNPYVTPVDLAAATPDQHEALKETPSHTKISEYVLVLAHDPQSLGERTPLYNAIMFGRGGLSRAERELGAVSASIVNRCVYCAAVHASRYNALVRRPEMVSQLFEQGAAAILEPRERAITAFATKLSETPPRVDEVDLAALVDAGLSHLEIVDLILAASLFGWANRLMHSLGEALALDKT
jgi:uncharacterized peroxidase-related enzyme